MAAAVSLCARKARLTDDDKFFVMKALIPLVGRWRHIGSALGLSSATLDTIGQGNQDEAIASLVNKWLSMNYNVDRFPEPSWDALVKAVAEPAGGANRMVAEEIAREYPPELEHGYSRGHSGLTGYEWFHGSLSREECATKMEAVEQSDCFLVRVSTSRENELTVSLKNEGGVLHFRILRGVNCCEVEGTFRQFFTVSELVDYYSTHSVTDNDRDKLLRPCPK